MPLAQTSTLEGSARNNGVSRNVRFGSKADIGLVKSPASLYGANSATQVVW